MQATIKNLKDASIGAKRDRLSNSFYKELAVIHPDLDAVARFRFYGNGSTIHCIAWLGCKDNWGSGYAKAGGYGYCKESAAMEDAIRQAGVTMSETWGGAGESKMREAAKAVGAALSGKRKFYLHWAYA